MDTKNMNPNGNTNINPDEDANFDPYEDFNRTQQEAAAYSQWWESLDYEQQESVKQSAIQQASALRTAWDRSLRAEKVKATELEAFVARRPDIHMAMANGELSPRQVARMVKEARGVPQPMRRSSSGAPRPRNEAKLTEVRGRLDNRLSDNERMEALADLAGELMRR